MAFFSLLYLPGISRVLRISLTSLQEPEEEEPEEDYDIEALVPKRESAKVVKKKK